MPMPLRSRALPIALLSVILCIGCATGPDPTTQAYIDDAHEAIGNSRFDEAKVMAELAVERNPHLRESRELLARIHRDLAMEATEKNHHGEAMKHWIKAAEYEPSRVQRAQNYMNAVELGPWLNAPPAQIAELATLAVEADPSLIEARRQAARHWDDAGETSHAIEHYQWLWSAYPDELQLGIRLGMLYLSADRLGDASAVLAAVLSADPLNVQAAMNRAAALEKMGARGEARQVFEEILEQFPDNASILLRYSAFLERMGETRRAANLRDRAHEHMPGVERREMRRLR
ncbi:MAG: tetratricopeptide repeat protein [Bradymonadaceae bacterium]